MASTNAATWISRAETALANAGYRRGAARSALVQLLADLSCASTADELAAQLAQRRSPVGKATIYRVLDQLEQLGLVQRVEVGEGVCRFERACSDHHHHHLVCTVCSGLVPFQDENLERAIHEISITQGLVITGHEVVLQGVCSSCVQRSDLATANELSTTSVARTRAFPAQVEPKLGLSRSASIQPAEEPLKRFYALQSLHLRARADATKAYADLCP